VIVERGTHRDLVARRGHYAALWEAQHSAVSLETTISAVASSVES
jgi:hypothetical protein